MHTPIRLNSRDSANSRSRPPSQDWGWLQIAVGMPLTLLMLAAVMLLALPDLLRRNTRRWERFGDR